MHVFPVNAVTCMNMTAGEPVEPLSFLGLTYPATDVRYFKTKYAHKTQTRFNVRFWHELCFRLAECGEFSQKHAHSNPFCQQRQRKAQKRMHHFASKPSHHKICTPYGASNFFFIRKLEQLNLFPTRIISSSNTTLRTESIYYSRGMEPC